MTRALEETRASLHSLRLGGFERFFDNGLLGRTHFGSSLWGRRSASSALDNTSGRRSPESKGGFSFPALP